MSDGSGVWGGTVGSINILVKELVTSVSAKVVTKEIRMKSLGGRVTSTPYRR